MRMCAAQKASEVRFYIKSTEDYKGLSTQELESDKAGTMATIRIMAYCGSGIRADSGQSHFRQLTSYSA